MPRLSDELWAARRRHVVLSAGRCFGRQGFHATTMDEIIAETGWSSSAVYRYVSGKDELIELTSRESMAQLGQIVTDLMTREPLPSPHDAVREVVSTLRGRRGDDGYELPRIIVQNWAEAVRTPAVRRLARTFWKRTRAQLAQLVEAWQAEGTVAAELDAHAVSAAIALMIPGIVLDAGVLDGASTRMLLGVLTPTGQEGTGPIEA